MDTMFLTLSAACGVVAFVCYVIVLIKMFQRDMAGLALGSIVLSVCCGIGGLIVFVVGWANSPQWRIKNLMLLWTGSIVVGIVSGTLGGAAEHISRWI